MRLLLAVVCNVEKEISDEVGKQDLALEVLKPIGPISMEVFFILCYFFRSDRGVGRYRPSRSYTCLSNVDKV